MKNLVNQKWSVEKAWDWYKKQPWLCGCNYIPFNAINELEMFQADTFDPKQIDLELGWAEDLAFNVLRVFLHFLLWESDATGFKQRVKQFLDICEKHHIKVLLVLFDDCWVQDPQMGKQPEPKPSVHNSGWAASPGRKRVLDQQYWPALQKYVVETIDTFKSDSRVLGWDLYNEPGNSNMLLQSLPLLIKCFEWARSVNPSQPLTSGIWHWNRFVFRLERSWYKIYEVQAQLSDIITYHDYNDVDKVIVRIKGLQKLKRPLICTEWMARKQNSRFETHLSIFKKFNVGCMNWGFVAGKTNTIFPWGTKEGSPEPALWFHDILRSDGSPYRVEEIEAIKNATKL